DREPLGAQVPRSPREEEHRRQGEPADAPHRAATPAGRDDRQGERRTRRCDVAQQSDLDSAGSVEAVEEELAEPLLVDPVAAMRPDRQRVVDRKAVMHVLVPAEDDEPTVGEELSRKRERKAHDVESDDGEKQRLAETPGDDVRDPASVDAGGWRRRGRDPVHDRLDVLDHRLSIELPATAGGTDRKAGPGWT